MASQEEFSVGAPDFAPFVEGGEIKPNSWTEPPASKFLVRGPDYLKQAEKNVLSLKQPSADAAYTCIGMNIFKSPVSLMHSAAKVEEFRNWLEKNADEDDETGAPKYLVICFMFSNMWGTEHTLVQHLYRRKIAQKGEDPALDAAMERFLAADDNGKNEQLKYMFKVVEGPAVMTGVVTTVGGERPVLIGRRLTTTYFRGKNYLEVNMDVGSAMIGQMLYSTMQQTAATAVLDEAWCLEAQKEKELPERILAMTRWNYCNPAVLFVKLNEKGERIES